MATYLTSYKGIQLINGCAKSSYNKEGVFIEEGVLSLRVHFSIFGISNRFDFMCQKENSQNADETVPFEINSEKVYFLVSDCSNRLHIPQAKILKFSKSDMLWKLFERKLKQFKLLDQIVDSYTTIIQNYDSACDGKFLHPKKSKELDSIQRKTLMKVVHLSLLELNGRLETCQMITLNAKTREKYQTHLFKILAFYPSEKPCFLIDMNSHENLIEGKFSNVWRINCISQGCFLSMKESKKGNQESYFDIEKEFKNIEALQQLSLNENILAPHFKTDIEKKIVVFSPYCNQRDLLELINKINDEDRVRLFSKSLCLLIGTLKKLHENKITHGDIKPENILVHKQEDGSYLFYLGDLGNASQAESDKKFFIGTCTPSYSPPCNLNEKFSLKEHMSRDVFQFGMTIVTAFTGEPPYQKTVKSINFPDFSIPFSEVGLSEYCSLQAVSLIKSMCHQEPLKRPTIAEVFSIVSNPSFIWEKASI